MNLGGVAEIRKRLGVSQATAENLVNSKGFPDPVGILARGRIWDLSEVRKWAKQVGRPWKT